MFTLEESALLAKLLRFVAWVLVFLIAGVAAALVRRAL
jgi:hypothetical protein